MPRQVLVPNRQNRCKTLHLELRQMAVGLQSRKNRVFRKCLILVEARDLLDQGRVGQIIPSSVRRAIDFSIIVRMGQKICNSKVCQISKKFLELWVVLHRCQKAEMVHSEAALNVHSLCFIAMLHMWQQDLHQRPPITYYFLIPLILKPCRKSLIKNF